ncbi:TonB-dependent receptor [Thiobacter aerophilum]|uniref:TonB-dependent receptor n=1 Tax=Thiobacter aerophilum TaxID=3121275 RepID=A0ABV0EHU1_9BURK
MPTRHLLLCFLLPVNAFAADTLEEITVTGTREPRLLAETPASVKVISGETLRADKPSHPAQVMGQAPGVWVNVTGGEGHMTAIRQPLTTNPVYLYLEDGIPTRSTGFFNHNALYEINLPQAGGIEVTRGPGTALYGSDAIGGVVNVLTRPAPPTPQLEVSAEVGEYGWKRLLASGGNTWGENGLRADLNLTTTDGWRDHTGYDRQSATLRWDRALGTDAVIKTVLTGSRIDQDTAGSSALVRADYENAPTKNYTPISYRKVSALRLSSAWERETGDTLVSLTPYLRDDSMELLANWSLSYDPTVYTTANRSFGLMGKWRRDFAPLRARLIAGVDLDASPGRREENRLATLTTTGSGVSKLYTAYSVGTRVYDYDVTFIGASPYVHGELSPTKRLRLSAGLRYDDLRYRFDNHFAAGAIAASTRENGGAPVTRYYGQSGDTTVRFHHLSPKLGVTFALDHDTHVFASYNHAFRAPSEGQLFRPSAQTNEARAQLAAASALGLKPVKADQYELGLRGKAASLDYEVSIYRLEKRDDILSYKDPVTSATQVVNAGKTLHRGVELGLGAPMSKAWRLDAALSYAKHSYEQWVIPGTADFSGKDMESAPRVIGNLRLSWSPAAGQRVQLEWVKLGRYWMDQANTRQYEGHDLFNLRANWALNKTLALYGSVQNLLDTRYAESASVSSGVDVFAPGLPRTLYAGIEAKW